MGPTVMLYIRFEAPISAVCQLLASGMENENREKNRKRHWGGNERDSRGIQGASDSRGIGLPRRGGAAMSLFPINRSLPVTPRSADLPCGYLSF